MTLALLFLAAAAIVASLEVAYAWMVERTAAGGAMAVALDLGAKGSLACWFSSLLLLAASAAALLVYSVRRYRIDDYPGRYRIWRWTAVVTLLMATDQAASLREGFRDGMIALTGTPLLGNGSFWWVAFYYVLLFAVGSRLLADMRPCRLSIVTMAAAAIAYSLALTTQLGWTPAEGVAGEVMFRVGAEMAADLLLLAAVTFHARYVLLDAEGLLPHRERPAVPAAKEPDEDAEDHEVKVLAPGGTSWRELDPPHPAAPQPAYQRAAVAPAVAAAPVFSSAAAAASSVNRKLTKQERRALKERLLRERQERERGGGD